LVLVVLVRQSMERMVALVQILYFLQLLLLVVAEEVGLATATVWREVQAVAVRIVQALEALVIPHQQFHRRVTTGVMVM
jgi:hypothetical protein